MKRPLCLAINGSAVRCGDVVRLTDDTLTTIDYDQSGGNLIRHGGGFTTSDRIKEVVIRAKERVSYAVVIMQDAEPVHCIEVCDNSDARVKQVFEDWCKLNKYNKSAFRPVLVPHYEAI